MSELVAAVAQRGRDATAHRAMAHQHHGAAAGLGHAGGGGQIDQRQRPDIRRARGRIRAHANAAGLLHTLGHAPGFEQPGVRHAAQGG